MRPFRPLLSVPLLMLVLSGCLPPPGISVAAWNKQQDERFHAALKKDDWDEVREMCVEPWFYEQGFFKRWTATESQEKACAALKRQWDADLRRQVEMAHEAGGLRCLLILQDHYRSTAMSQRWTAKWETAEARRAEISPHAEPCLASLEEMAGSGRHGALYLALGEKLSLITPEALLPAQFERLDVVSRGIHPNAAKEYETAAAGLRDEPAAAALYLAAAAVVAGEGGDAERAAKNVSDAKAAVARAGVQQKLPVHVAGDGLGATVAKSVLSGSPGPGLEFKAKAPLVFRVQLAAPTFNTGRMSTTLSASYKVQKGTQPNPRYKQEAHYCETDRHFLKQAIWSCNKNGPRNANCPRIASLRQKAERCEAKLARLERTVPAWSTESVSYDAVRFSGSASGRLTLTQGRQAPAPEEVRATLSRVQHGAVPKAELSAVSASPVTEAELREEYLREAASLVRSRIHAVGASRLSEILAAAKAAKEPREVAGQLVRYALVAQSTPTRTDAAELGSRLGVPAYAALELLLGKGD